MKLYNIYRTLHLTVLVLAVTSCSKNEPMAPDGTEPGQPVSISITDGGYVSADACNATNDPASRAVENGYTTEFTEGDACGLFVVRGGKPVYSNEKLTAERDAATGDLVWKTEEGTTLSGGLSDEHYYLYYPYQTDMTDKTATLTGNAPTDAEFFAPLIASWQPQKDQSTYANYTKSDLMTAKGTAAKGTNNTLRLSFSMTHRMALAVIEMPATVYEFTNTPAIPAYTVRIPARFQTENLPYALPGGVYRYVVHPANATKLIGSYDDGKERGFAIEFAAGGLGSGISKTYKVDSERATPQSHHLQIGDFFLADGRLLSKDAEQSEVQAAKVIGIVFRTASGRIGEAEKRALGESNVHGLVMSVRNAAASAQWSSETHEFEGLKNCESKSDNYNDISGLYNYRTVIDYAEKNGKLSSYPAFEAVAKWNADGSGHEAPDHTTGWFLASSGQYWDILQNLGGYAALADPTEQGSTDTGNTIFSWSNQGDGPRRLNVWMEKIANGNKDKFVSGCLWVSSEYSVNKAQCWFMESSGYVHCISEEKEESSIGVRPVLAF